MPTAKYRHFLDVNPVRLPDRRWPDRRIDKAPRWLSTDLRDGNQALIEPMDPARKRMLFDLLVRLGVKEIEIGFPAASAADLEFCRSLADGGLVPEDVTISVLTQSRPEIIHATVDALDGLPRATVHLYNATAPVFRRVVFHNDREATKQLTVSGAQELVAYMEKTLGDDTVAVVDAHVEDELGVAGRQVLGGSQLLEDGGPQTGGPADPADPHPPCVEVVALGPQHLAGESHDEANLGGAALPVLGGEGVGGQLRHAYLQRSGDDVHEGGLPRPVAFDAGQAARVGPPPVSVHDHRDVPRHDRQPRRPGARGVRGRRDGFAPRAVSRRLRACRRHAVSTSLRERTRRSTCHCR